MQCSTNKDNEAAADGQDDDDVSGDVTAVRCAGARVYCSVCGVSFNSDQQSAQHYRGKLHAKKLRLARHLTRVGFTVSRI